PVDPHRAAGPSLGERDTRDLADFLESAVTAIMEEEIADGVIRHNDVRPAVVIHVTHHHTQRLGNRPVQRPEYLHTRLGGDVLERSIATVAIEQALRPLEGDGGTVGATVTHELETLAQVERRRPADVIADEEIEPAIPIVVEKCG